MFTKRETIIKSYIESYNTFDIEGMINHLSEDVLFQNIQGEVTTLSLKGREAFQKQAQDALNYFSERKQTILSFNHTENTTEVELFYEAVLAMDFPNGMKKGEQLQLSGRSIFEFEGDSIKKLTDISSS